MRLFRALPIPGLLLLITSLLAAEDQPAGPLKAYVDQPDDSFRWTERRRGKAGDASFVELTLTSQTWHGTVWKHQLFVLKPAEIRDGSRALLMIGGGNWNESLAKPISDDAKDMPAQ